jgi:acyl carrier protein
LDTLLADLSIDSLDAVELLCLIDEEFDVRLEPGSLEKFATVGELADAIAARGASVRHR